MRAANMMIANITKNTSSNNSFAEALNVWMRILRPEKCLK